MPVLRDGFSPRRKFWLWLRPSILDIGSWSFLVALLDSALAKWLPFAHLARYSNSNRYDPRTITVVSGRPPIGPPKTRASVRTVALPRFLSEDLAIHAPAKGLDDLLFAAPRGGKISPTTWRRRVWGPAIVWAGLEGVTFHSLRQSPGALLIEQGEHPLVVAPRLGHTSVRTVLDVWPSVRWHRPGRRRST